MGKQNYIGANGELWFDKWYDSFYAYEYTSVMDVRDGEKHNLIDYNGNLLFTEWFDSITMFDGGYCVVQNQVSARVHDRIFKLYDINRRCFLSDTWVAGICDGFDGRYARCYIVDEKRSHIGNYVYRYNCIDTKTMKPIFDKTYDQMGTFYDGYVTVGKWSTEGGKRMLHNMADTQGNLLSDEWFESIDIFSEGYAVVSKKDEKDGKARYNYIDKKGNYLLDKWYRRVFDFSCGWGLVGDAYMEHGEKHVLFNFVNNKGEYMFDEPVSEASSFYDGYAFIAKTRGGRGIWIDTTGEECGFPDNGYYYTEESPFVDV